MNRLGLSEPDWDPVVRELSNAKGFRVEGLFTHFAESENPDRSFLGEQLARFRKAIAFFESALGRRLIRHAANSGATLGAPETHFDWVRPGIAVYGYPPAPTPDGVQGFRPVLHWRAPILQVKELRAEDSVGYGRAFRSPGRMRIATVGAGYGDGYRRSYGAAGVGFRGRRAPVVGLVCMDLLMVDVTPFPDVRIGEEVTLLGVPEEGAPDAAELARVAGVIPYEVLTGISARVTRTVRHGRGDRC
jgi:alanine racemase